MSNFLKNIDRIGKEFKFSIEGSETYTTSLGGIISILYYIGIISLFCFFGKELVLKEDPNFIHRNDQTNEFSFINLTESNFFIAICISDYNSEVVFDNRYFDVELIKQST